MRALLIAAIALSAAGPAAAQQAKFDAASIRQCRDHDDGPQGIHISGKRLQLPCFPLIQIIATAYGESVGGQWIRFPMSAMEGSPPWIHDLYTVEARADGDAGTDMVQGPMLRALLDERFHLQVRRETRQMPAFGLIVGRHGAKLKPFDGSCTPWDAAKPESPTPDKPSCSFSMSGRESARIQDYRGITVRTFVQRFSESAMRLGDLPGPIIDRTELSGRFDIHLEYMGEGGILDGGLRALPSLPEALDEQLGLKLEKTTAPREFLVIEKIERPSSN